MAVAERYVFKFAQVPSDNDADLMIAAAELAVCARVISVRILQHRLWVTTTKARRIIRRLEACHILAASGTDEAGSVLLHDDQFQLALVLLKSVPPFVVGPSLDEGP